MLDHLGIPEPKEFDCLSIYGSQHSRTRLTTGPAPMDSRRQFVTFTDHILNAYVQRDKGCASSRYDPAEPLRATYLGLA